MEIQSISIVGAGNLATHLARAFYFNNIKIRQIFSRERGHAQSLAAETGAEAITDIHSIEPADLIIICVTDSAIAQVAESLRGKHPFVVHTSGSTSMEILHHFPVYGVFYPFQTFSKNVMVDFQQVPLFIEASHPDKQQTLLSLGRRLSEHVNLLDSENRMMLHLAAVFASNFANHMFALSKEILDQAGLDFTLLDPLISETTRKAIQSQDPRRVQTGPAVRGNMDILTKHKEILQDSPLWQKIYTFVSESIQEEAKNCK